MMVVQTLSFGARRRANRTAKCTASIDRDTACTAGTKACTAGNPVFVLSVVVLVSPSCCIFVVFVIYGPIYPYIGVVLFIIYRCIVVGPNRKRREGVSSANSNEKSVTKKKSKNMFC